MVKKSKKDKFKEKLSPFFNLFFYVLGGKDEKGKVFFFLIKV